MAQSSYQVVHKKCGALVPISSFKLSENEVITHIHVSV